MARKPKLSKNPEAMEKVSEIIATGRNLTAKDPKNLKEMRQLLSNRTIGSMMEEVLNMSNLAQSQKDFLKYLYVDGLSQHKALTKAFGRDLGYAEEEIGAALRSHPDVKEFISLLKYMYVQIAPVAQMKEVELMLDPKSPADIQLKASQSIQAKAGLAEEEKTARDLPVKINITLAQGNVLPPQKQDYDEE